MNDKARFCGLCRFSPWRTARRSALLPEWTVPEGHIQLAYPHRRGRSPAGRAGIELLSDALGRWNYPA